MLRVKYLDTNLEHEVNIEKHFPAGILRSDFTIIADGEELKFILQDFVGIKKSRTANIQIFVGEDAKFIAANWHLIMSSKQ